MFASLQIPYWRRGPLTTQIHAIEDSPKMEGESFPLSHASFTHWQTSSTSMLLWLSLCWLLYTPCFTHAPCPLFKIILSLKAKISFWIYYTVSYETETDPAGLSQVQKHLQVPCFLFIQKCIRLLGSMSSKDKVQAVTNYISERMKKQRKSS